MLVKNLINARGNTIANQFVITDNNITVFQSYNSVVCVIDFDINTITFGIDFDYSKTTMKHLITFLQMFPITMELHNIASVRKAIKTGGYNNVSVVYDETLR